MKKQFGLGMFALMGLASQAMAAITTYETRAIDTPVNNSDYQASWSAQSSAINSQILADFNGSLIPGGVPGGFSHLSVAFSNAVAGNWGFRLAPDAGLGGEIRLDGVMLMRDVNDLWWAGDWTNPLELLTVGNIAVSAGNHVFEGFWAEQCCNGTQGLEYTKDGGRTWSSMAELANPVPVPAAAWLFGSALFGLLGFGRRAAA